MRSHQLLIYQQSLLYLTNEQHVLLSNLKMRIAVKNRDVNLPYPSIYEIECLITLLV